MYIFLNCFGCYHKRYFDKLFDSLEFYKKIYPIYYKVTQRYNFTLEMHGINRKTMQILTHI